MITCSYCNEQIPEEEIDDENNICPCCGMPLGYTGEGEAEENEIEEFFNDEDEENFDPDALTDKDIEELLKGVEIEEDIDFDDSELDDDEDED